MFTYANAVLLKVNYFHGIIMHSYQLVINHTKKKGLQWLLVKKWQLMLHKTTSHQKKTSSRITSCDKFHHMSVNKSTQQIYKINYEIPKSIKEKQMGRTYISISFPCRGHARNGMSSFLHTNYVIFIDCVCFIIWTCLHFDKHHIIL